MEDLIQKKEEQVTYKSQKPKLFRRTSNESKIYAKEQGLICDVISPSMLFVDIDTVDQMKQFDRMLPSIEHLLSFAYGYGPNGKNHAISEIFVNRSKSDNFHIRIRLTRPYTIPERIAMQLMLGSDPRKEACSMNGHYQKEIDCILAFELPNYLDNIIVFNSETDTLEALDFEKRLGQKKGDDMLYTLEHGRPPYALLRPTVVYDDY